MKKFFSIISKIIKFIVKHIFALVFLISFTILFLCSSIWVLALYLLNANNVGGKVADMLQRSIGRPIIISNITISSPTSFTFEDVKIVDDTNDTYQEILSVKSVILRYDFLPLLDHKLIIKEIILDSPTITIKHFQDGTYNIPKIKFSDNNHTTSFNIDTSYGTKWQVLIKDWIIKSGTFAYKNDIKNVSHSFNGVDLRLYDLKFNEPTLFDASFILRNKLENKVIETEVNSRGLINFADFILQDMALQNTDITLHALKEPINVSLSLKNFTNPDITLWAEIPPLSQEDINFFITLKDKISLPAMSLNLTALFSDNFNKFNLSSFNFESKDIKFSAKSELDLSKENIEGNLTFETDSFNPNNIDYWNKLKSFSLKGNIKATGELTFINKKIKYPQLNISTEQLDAKIDKFTIQKANASIDIKNDFDSFSGIVKKGKFLVGRQVIDNIKGRANYEKKKNYFYGFIESASLNNKYIKMSVDITKVRDEAKRQIKTLLALQEFNPIEVYNIVEDFVIALSDNSSTTTEEKRDTSDLSWLRNFRADLPVFMSNFKGSIFADTFTSPILSGKNFFAEFDLKNILPGMKDLDGTLDAKLSNGVIYKLQEAAERQKALGIAYQPFLIMSKMEMAGSFKMGQILTDTPFDIMFTSVNFNKGSMDINNFYVDGDVISGVVSGNVDWVKETLKLNIMTMFKNTSKNGALSENLTDSSGAPALAFDTEGSMLKPSLTMQRPKKTSKTIKEAREKQPRTNFNEIIKFKE